MHLVELLGWLGGSDELASRFTELSVRPNSNSPMLCYTHLIYCHKRLLSSKINMYDCFYISINFSENNFKWNNSYLNNLSNYNCIDRPLHGHDIYMYLIICVCVWCTQMEWAIHIKFSVIFIFSLGIIALALILLLFNFGLFI